MKLGNSIEYNKTDIFLQKFMKKIRQGDQFQISFFLKKKKKEEALHEVKGSGLQISFNMSRQPSTYLSIKANSIKLQTVDLEICSILSFYGRACEQFFHRILCMILPENWSPLHILLTDQISLPDCLYFFRYWETFYSNCLLTRL